MSRDAKGRRQCLQSFPPEKFLCPCSRMIYPSFIFLTYIFLKFFRVLADVMVKPDQFSRFIFSELRRKFSCQFTDSEQMLFQRLFAIFVCVLMSQIFHGRILRSSCEKNLRYRRCHNFVIITLINLSYTPRVVNQ